MGLTRGQAAQDSPYKHVAFSKTWIHWDTQTRDSWKAWTVLHCPFHPLILVRDAILLFHSPPPRKPTSHRTRQASITVQPNSFCLCLPVIIMTDTLYAHAPLLSTSPPAVMTPSKVTTGPLRPHVYEPFLSTFGNLAPGFLLVETPPPHQTLPYMLLKSFSPACRRHTDDQSLPDTVGTQKVPGAHESARFVQQLQFSFWVLPHVLVPESLTTT